MATKLGTTLAWSFEHSSKSLLLCCCCFFFFTSCDIHCWLSYCPDSRMWELHTLTVMNSWWNLSSYKASNDLNDLGLKLFMDLHEQSTNPHFPKKNWPRNFLYQLLHRSWYMLYWIVLVCACRSQNQSSKFYWGIWKACRATRGGWLWRRPRKCLKDTKETTWKMDSVC